MQHPCLLLWITLVVSTAISPGFVVANTLPFNCNDPVASNVKSKNAIPTTLDYQLAAYYPHQTDAFSQGLVFFDGLLYESTGLYGASRLSQLPLGSDQPIIEHKLAERYFGEGLVEFNGELIQLTWKSGDVLRYQLATDETQGGQKFKHISTHKIEGEGWGITTNGKSLITSNGSALLTYRDPSTLAAQKTLEVRAMGRPLKRLNELEWVNGCVLANIWGSDNIAIIDPSGGQVLHTINLGPIARREREKNKDHVTNGIAYRPDNGHLLVTGKNWQYIYELKIR